MTYSFTAPNPKAALDQIHRQLGPQAVVLSVRPLRAYGLARLWRGKGPVEIIAGVPDTPEPAGPSSHLPENTDAVLLDQFPAPTPLWQTVRSLISMGLLPANAERLQCLLQSDYPEARRSPETEYAAVHAALASLWPPLHSEQISPKIHVFIGPPGSGKTVTLCKWLTLAVLTQQRSARVWRLDGLGANTAESLAVHCEMLGVPLDRFWAQPAPAADLCFVDLPGVEMNDWRALTMLAGQLSMLPTPEIHLVLNAAYQTEVLLAQYKAFAGLQPTDLILTHLDEEPGRVKLWNLVLAACCPIRFLSGGQSVPGQFCEASPASLLPVS